MRVAESTRGHNRGRQGRVCSVLRFTKEEKAAGREPEWSLQDFRCLPVRENRSIKCHNGVYKFSLRVYKCEESH